jgi:Uma2 family endonuclease
MAIATQPTANNFAVPPFPVRRWTVAEYHQLIQIGVFAHDEQFELLEGWIVPKMSRNPPHDVALDKAQEVIRHNLPAGWRLRVQSAITTGDSEPEPDLAAVLGPAERYLDHHPGPTEIGTLIEVAESSLAQDRVEKGRIYARAKIPVYWIINLVDRRIEVYTDPTGPDRMPCYRQRQDYGANQSVPLCIEGRVVAQLPVQELLP